MELKSQSIRLYAGSNLYIIFQSYRECIEQMAHRVFVSHSGEDTWVAKQIAKEIESLGAESFLDEAQIAIGGDFEDEILKFLEQANELIVLITPWALDRPYVWAELGAAWGRKIPIVALLHGISAEQLQQKPGIPVLLKRRNLIHLNDYSTFKS